MPTTLTVKQKPAEAAPQDRVISSLQELQSSPFTSPVTHSRPTHSRTTRSHPMERQQSSPEAQPKSCHQKQSEPSTTTSCTKGIPAHHVTLKKHKYQSSQGNRINKWGNIIQPVHPQQNPKTSAATGTSAANDTIQSICDATGPSFSNGQTCNSPDSSAWTQHHLTDSKQELHPSKSGRLKRRSRLREHVAPTQHPTDSISPTTSTNSPRQPQESPTAHQQVASALKSNPASSRTETESISYRQAILH
ncbi:hypothetical protein Nepgr_033572 [Nepenthes gracilis]|uniref:Uncharacterized protein n=1 Tax=Nepenthes gracilis TaxID=150966 RepID=A0AAD3TKV3_NEPGR|nr:hypothetical protein Nepgr_033572 [Nepenthes gracilis]